MKYAFYISGSSKRVHDFLAQSAPTIVNKIAFVISDETTPESFISFLLEKNIEFIQINRNDRRGLSASEKNQRSSDTILAALRQHDVDYMFCFGEHLLMGELLVEYKNRIINFHPAILPMYPGLNAIDQAAEHGNTLLVGNTAHFIDDGIDTGPIIMQSIIPLKPFLESENDYDIILDLITKMLKDIVHLLEDGRIRVIGDRVEIQGANYFTSVTFPSIE